MVKRLLLLSNRYSSSHSNLCNSKWPLLKVLYLKAILPLSNRLSSLPSHRCNSLHVLLSLMVKRPLLLSNRYSRYHNSNSHISLCNNK